MQLHEYLPVLVQILHLTQSLTKVKRMSLRAFLQTEILRTSLRVTTHIDAQFALAVAMTSVAFQNAQNFGPFFTVSILVQKTCN